MGGEALVRKQICVFMWSAEDDGRIPTVSPPPGRQQPLRGVVCGAWRSATIVGFEPRTGLYTIKYHHEHRANNCKLYLPLAVLHFARLPPPPGKAPRSCLEGRSPLPPVLLPPLAAPPPRRPRAVGGAPQAAARNLHPVLLQELMCLQPGLGSCFQEPPPPQQQPRQHQECAQSAPEPDSARVMGGLKRERKEEEQGVPHWSPPLPSLPPTSQLHGQQQAQPHQPGLMQPGALLQQDLLAARGSQSLPAPVSVPQRQLSARLLSCADTESADSTPAAPASPQLSTQGIASAAAAGARLLPLPMLPPLPPRASVTAMPQVCLPGPSQAGNALPDAVHAAPTSHPSLSMATGRIAGGSVSGPWPTPVASAAAAGAAAPGLGVLASFSTAEPRPSAVQQHSGAMSPHAYEAPAEIPGGSPYACWQPSGLSTRAQLAVPSAGHIAMSAVHRLAHPSPSQYVEGARLWEEQQQQQQQQQQLGPRLDGHQLGAWGADLAAGRIARPDGVAAQNAYLQFELNQTPVPTCGSAGMASNGFTSCSDGLPEVSAAPLGVLQSGMNVGPSLQAPGAVSCTWLGASAGHERLDSGGDGCFDDGCFGDGGFAGGGFGGGSFASSGFGGGAAATAAGLPEPFGAASPNSLSWQHAIAATTLTSPPPFLLPQRHNQLAATPTDHVSWASEACLPVKRARNGEPWGLGTQLGMTSHSLGSVPWSHSPVGLEPNGRAAWGPSMDLWC